MALETCIVRTEESPAYLVDPLDDDAIVKRALEILAARVAPGRALTSPGDVRDYLRVKLGPLGHEVFAAVFVDVQHRVIDIVEMFRGTLSRASVYPREVVKAALARNAAAVIFAHNHPSGVAEPSRADEDMTKILRAALDLIDVRTLDHFVVSPSGFVSFAERGLL
jgi:DNA repair protein RadC